MARPDPRPRVVLNAVPDDAVPAGKRPDAALPLVVAAFALGVVLAATGALALRWTGGDTVPAKVHDATVAELAGARAAHDADARQLAGLDESLDAADALARRLVAALAAPDTTVDEIAALRREVARQHTTIERTRERIRVVRVPVPAPTPAPAAARPQPAVRDPSPAAAPSASPAACWLELLGLCLNR